mgnify:CR=1 FL=1
MKKELLCGLLCLMLISVSCSKEELTDSNEELIEIVEDEIVDEDDNEEPQDDKENEGTEALNISEEILELVNEHRVSIGKSALIRNPTADELAAEHSNYMISKGAISHDNFMLRFQQLQQEVNANSAGENVAAGYPTAEAVMRAWLNSSGHKKNIEGDFTHIGIASIRNSQGRYYYTQLFYR